MGLKENLAYLFFFILRILHIRPYNDIPDEFIIYVIMISSTFSINSLSQKKKKGPSFKFISSWFSLMKNSKITTNITIKGLQIEVATINVIGVVLTISK